MNKLRYREDLYAQEILKNGFLTKYHVHEMKILVKYYKSIGIKPKERKQLIYEFCEKHIIDFNKVLYFRSINSALNVGNRKFNNLIVIKEIPIKKNELDYINKLDIEYLYKKVVFTLLVQSKVNTIVCDFLFGKHSDYNFFGGKSQYFKEIFIQSKIPSHSVIDGSNLKNDINKIINELDKQQVIKIGNRGRINLSFINQITETDDVEFTITAFDDIGYYFDFHNRENNVIKCEGCNKLVKTTGKNHRMCRNCWKSKQKELWRGASKKYRSKEKSS